MLIFFKGIGSEATARDKLKHTAEALHTRLAAKTTRGELHCSFGAAMCPQDGHDFGTLYKTQITRFMRQRKRKIVSFDLTTSGDFFLIRSFQR